MKVPQVTRVLKLQKMEKVIHHMTTETQMIQMDMVIIQKITVIIRGMILRDIDSIWETLRSEKAPYTDTTYLPELPKRVKKV